MAYVYEATDLLMSAHERADDIPLLIAHLRRMGVPELLDKHLPPGGMWGRTSPGWVATIWLAHILSQSEGKLPHVQPWVATHPETLRACLGHEVSPADVHELRLRDLLHALGDDAPWLRFEAELNARLLHDYKLEARQVSLHWPEGWSWLVLPEGVLQIGQARSWRPGTLRINVLHAALDPIGLPLATGVAAGRALAEQQLVDMVRQVQAVAPRSGMLFVGEETRRLEVRAAVQAGGGSYLCRLSEPQATSEGLTSVGHSVAALLFAPDEGGGAPAEGQEWSEVVQAEDGARWGERRLLLRARSQATAAETLLRERLAQAQHAVAALAERRRGKRRPRTMDALQIAVDEIAERYQVRGLLSFDYAEEIEERMVRRYRGRPTVLRVERDVQVSARVDEAAVRRAVSQLAWELYATNLPASSLPAAALLRPPTPSEPTFDRLTGRPISLTPGGLQRDEHAVGLVRLMSLGLRALVLLEASVVRQLASEDGAERSDASGVRRRVAQQAGERLLEAFREIAITSARGARRVALTPLTPLQRHVLQLLMLPPEIYS